MQSKFSLKIADRPPPWPEDHRELKYRESCSNNSEKALGLLGDIQVSDTQRKSKQ